MAAAAIIDCGSHFLCNTAHSTVLHVISVYVNQNLRTSMVQTTREQLYLYTFMLHLSSNKKSKDLNL